MSTLTITTINGTYEVRHAPDVKGAPACIKHTPNPGAGPSRTNNGFVSIAGFRLARINGGPHVQLVTGHSTTPEVNFLRTSVVQSLAADGIEIPVVAFGVTRMGNR